jgi:alpha/beta superfamily hydrolase
MEGAEPGLALEGLFIAAEESNRGGAVIAPPHPLFGGSMDTPVVSELAWSCTQAGLASLRFNWRGVGASAGLPSGEFEDAEADVRAALAQLVDTAGGELVLAGYSFGAAVVARVARHAERVRRLLLVAPPPDLFGSEGLRGIDGSILLVSGEFDAIAPAQRLEALAASHRHARFILIEQADHFFTAGLAGFGAAAADWLGGD